jgi:hypothetical protein
MKNCARRLRPENTPVFRHGRGLFDAMTVFGYVERIGPLGLKKRRLLENDHS